MTIPTLDARVLEELKDTIGSGALHELLAKFKDNVTCHREQLAGAIDGEDATRIRRIAHGVSGLCAQLGAPRAAETAVRVEASTSLNDAHALMTCLDDLIQALAENAGASGQ